MIYTRYHIREGARTTAGGIVKASSAFFKLNGMALAREGDTVDCPECGTQGVIVCVQPRLIDRFEGKEYALSDDLCVCQCNPSPKLVADQKNHFQTLALASEDTAEEAAGAAVKANVADMQPFRFFNQQTGEPHADRPYRLELKDGKVLAGTTNADGCTRPLTEEERNALITWHVMPYG